VIGGELGRSENYVVFRAVIGTGGDWSGGLPKPMKLEGLKSV